MKQPTSFLVILLALSSCGQGGEKNITNHNKSQIIEQVATTQSMKPINETWTIYFRQDTIYHVKRLVTKDNNFHLLTYDINTSQPENAEQVFINDKVIADLKEAEKLKSQASKYNWTPYKMAKQTLFVQIEPSAFKDEMDALNKRQEIEQKIEAALKSTNNGEWTDGDLGPGGANMLFEVQNIDNAILTILNLLSNEGFENKTLIGRRINTAKDNWFYEVIYPLNYSGQFLTM